MSQAVDVFGLGQCAYDRILVVPRALGPDEKVEGEGLVEQCGGPAATALYALSIWGRRCAFSGVVGDDDAGSAMRTDLEQVGVDTSRMIVREGQRSQQAFIAVERDTGKRQILWQRPTGAPPRDLTVPDMRVFLTDGLFVDEAVRIARDAPLVVVDAGTLREGTQAMLSEADVFVASASFGRALTDDDDPIAACRKIAEHGASVAGITLGSEGYVALIDGHIVRRPAYAVRAVDTTGCGDVFHAGLVEGLLRGWTPADALELGAWAAAQVATRLGARAGLPRELEAFPGARP